MSKVEVSTTDIAGGVAAGGLMALSTNEFVVDYTNRNLTPERIILDALGFAAAAVLIKLLLRTRKQTPTVSNVEQDSEPKA
jgi:hypothetical protein